uniref:Ephrin RBD domain-containing protein n=1 Tax=Panagrellus redivivus TaxID=6233 RepID=A0A7E4ZS90_PANRE
MDECWRPKLPFGNDNNHRLFRVFLLVMTSMTFANAKKLPDVYWNSTNPMFDMSNTDHVKNVRIMDRVTFICPLPHRSSDYEFSKLYMVSREDYENCQLHSEKLVGSCVTPERHSSISLVFRDFSPLPSALEFQPGRSYYIISTSNGTRSGLDNAHGGLCARRHMKMRFDVLPDDSVRSETADGDTVLSGSNVPTESTGDSPLMYIIHTVGPETMPSAAHSARNVENAPDSAATAQISIFGLSICLLLTFLNQNLRLF